nr:EOG090X03V0 [Cyclestheria hislopi]
MKVIGSCLVHENFVHYLSTWLSSTTQATTSTTTTKPRPTQQPTTTRPKPTTTTAAPSVADNKRCKGTCVTGFFSYLCDFIDSQAICPNGGKCCISRREGSPSSRPQNRTSEAVVTTTRAPTTARPRPTTTTTAAPLKQCPGVCLPGLMGAFCTKPSVVIRTPANLCEKGAVCCESKTKTGTEATTAAPAKPSTAAPKPSNPFNNPLASLLAGPILSNLAGAALQRPSFISGGDKSDTVPRPSVVQTPAARPPPPAPTTTTTAAPQVVDSRQFCPGTCIAPFLSFTCFSNAEITDLFRCPSSKVVCCAPKSAIRDLRPTSGTVGIPQTEFGNSRPGTAIRPPPQVRPNTAVVSPNPPAQQQQPPHVPAARPTANKPSLNRRFVCGVRGSEREQHGKELSNTTLSIESGRREGRVVGGSDAYPGKYCWQVALINSMNQYLCGAALIGSGWALTAAHCVTNIVRSGDAIYVRVGDHDLTSRYGSPGAQTLRSVPETGKRCIVTGYGYMGETGPIPLRVREAEVPIVSESECVRQINAVTEKIFIMPAASFCAGGEAGNDACQGDGGGPLACEDDGYFELTGLVSWGFGCGRQEVPGVYVRVSSFISWINQIISVNNV